MAVNKKIEEGLDFIKAAEKRYVVNIELLTSFLVSSMAGCPLSLGLLDNNLY
jgi:hypothetical protein